MQMQLQRWNICRLLEIKMWTSVRLSPAERSALNSYKKLGIIVFRSIAYEEEPFIDYTNTYDFAWQQTTI